MPFQLPELPQSIQDPAIKDFLEKYYEVSNDADAHDEYTALFTPDGEFSMNGKKAKGYEGSNASITFFWTLIYIAFFRSV